ncbi:MAG TPA: DUF308 domain-containing protein [Thermoleophilaceae bacterium]|nr:DUF308 domain-containing protein [Thermoleophilaceae bacterium]
MTQPAHEPHGAERSHSGAGVDDPGLGMSRRDAALALSRGWWLWLAAGVGWFVVALVVLQFDEASIKTVGVITGVMFCLSGLQQLAMAAMVDSLRWVWALFGVLFLIAGVVCFVNPEETFAGLADILGFIFLLIGIWWTIRAFLERAVSPVWWLGLVSGLLMIVLAFWTSGQFFVDKAYTLLVFAGIWALMHGVTDVTRAFQIRALRDLV